METTRRGAILATVGIVAIPGCGMRIDSEPPEQVSNGTASTATTATETASTATTAAETTPSETTPGAEPDPTDPLEEVSLEDAIDIYIHERDGQVRAIDRADGIVSRSDDLGRVINEAQATLSTGYILVAADGSSGMEIGHEDNVAIGGIEGRTALTPADDADSSFAMFSTTNGPDGGRLESFHIDMERRGGSAIRSAGYADMVFDGLQIRRTVKNGLSLADGRSAVVRNSQFTDVGDDAIRLDDTSDVAIHNCTSIGGNYGIYARSSSDLVVRDYRSQATRFNGVAIYDYTENWKVISCRAVNDGHTPFAASPALNGSFIRCIAAGTTADGEGGFEIEYKADHDSSSREDPVVGCAVVACVAIDCNMGFYAREDVSEEPTNTSVIRPKFIDCTAVGCETGLFIDSNVVEAIIRDFNPVACTTDIVDDGTRTVIDGRSENAGDPAVEGQWHGHGATAAELDVTIDDTVNDARYRATATGTWQRIS